MEPRVAALDHDCQLPPGEPKGGTGALHEQAWATFARDLESLLQTDRGKWVAYRGTKQVCIGDSPSAVYGECQRNGFDPKELFVELVYAAATEVPTIFLAFTVEYPEDNA